MRLRAVVALAAITAALPAEAQVPSASGPSPELSEPTVRLDAALTYRPLYGSTILGGGVDVSYGGWFRADLGIVAGSTLSGRRVGAYRIAFGYMAPWDRFHFGVGGGLEVVTVDEVTTNGSMVMVLAELYVTALADLSRWRGGTFFAGLRGGAEPFFAAWSDGGITGTVSLLTGVAFN